MEIKTIIFDCGRVFLHDPDNDIIFFDIAKACGIPYQTVESVVNELIPPYQRGDLTDKTFWKTFLKRTGLHQLPLNYGTLWTNSYLNLSKIDKGILNLVQKLKENGYCTPVLSNTIPPHVKVNRQRGLFNLFEPEIFSCEVGSKKPEKLIYHIALERTGVQAAEAVYVDDVEEYVKVAEEIGIKGIHFQNQTQLMRELRRLGIRI